MDEARKRQVTIKRRLNRAKKRAAKEKQPYLHDARVDQNTLWVWSDTKFATFADVWPGARP
jgi:hypothetical protein